MVKGTGCLHCQLQGQCDTVQYRGSRCAELRDKAGLGDPKTRYDVLVGMTPEQIAGSKYLRLPECDDSAKRRCSIYEGNCKACRVGWLMEAAAGMQA